MPAATATKPPTTPKPVTPAVPVAAPDSGDALAAATAKLTQLRRGDITAALAKYRALVGTLAANERLSAGLADELNAAMNTLGLTVRALGEDVRAVRQHTTHQQAIAGNTKALAELEREVPTWNAEEERLKKALADLRVKRFRYESLATSGGQLRGAMEQAARTAHRVLGDFETEAALIADPPPPEQPTGFRVIRSSDGAPDLNGKAQPVELPYMGTMG